MDAPELSSPRLRAFVAVARSGGFSSAARALGLSQSSVSQAIAALEEEIAQPLFVRTARRVHLTEAGVILLEHSGRALAELARAADLIAGLGSLNRGRVRVGTSDTLAAYLLPPLFAEFRDRYPGIELQLENRTSPLVAEAVAERRVDLGVVSLPLPVGQRGRSLRIEPLAPQRDVVIAAPGHRFAKRREIAFEQLLEEPLVLLDPSTATRGLFERRLQKLGLRARVVMEMSSVEVVKRLVERGFGLSVIPAMAVEREVRDGTLRALRLAARRDEQASGAERRVALVTHTRSALSGAARAFAELLRSRLQGGSGAKNSAPRKA